MTNMTARTALVQRLPDGGAVRQEHFGLVVRGFGLGDDVFDVLADPRGDAVDAPVFRDEFLDQPAALLNALPVVFAEGHFSAVTGDGHQVAKRNFAAQNDLPDIVRPIHAPPPRR
jgi:hypothetical protein